MCFDGGLSLLSAAAGAAGTIMKFSADRARAKAENARWQQNQVNALAAKRDTERQLTLREMQEAQATGQQLHLSQLDESRRAASAIVSSVASGVGGITVDSLVADIGRRAEDNRVTLLTNWEMVAAQLQAQKEGTEATYLRRVNSVGTAEEPSFLSPVLGIAGTGLNYFASRER